MVFSKATGQSLSSRWESEQRYGALDLASVGERGLHDARPSSAALPLADGVDIEVIRRYLGHSSVELTSRTYLHKSAKSVTRISEVVARIREQGREESAA